MKCPNCQTENLDRAKFCTDCGQSLNVDVICSKCQHVNKVKAKFCEECGQALAGLTPKPTATSAPPPVTPPAPTQPASFANGRYQVKKFLGEGGKKKVYLAKDTILDRDVAFALIKTEKLDEAGRTRVKREAQAMARLDHPNIVSVLDFGDHEGQPFMVLPLLSGGDVEGLIKKAPEHKLPLDQAIAITRAVASGLVFAHSKGIIHRDIKPGNVWLSSDGTAKIGDFGLAVAVDLSRLTQHGMMVGTVSYMPPEQAMGGEVTAKADLYSLGAMLYEMVTGRPPFIGDDSVAIIGQHINTPPVSPTWHRADLPPALETLILQLLEKDPGKRPASAKEVYQVLESLEASKVKPVTVPQPPATTADNPIYRRVFVGREAELKQLESAFDGAMSGQGALMMVVGEPGIGKTATCEQLATYVALRGGKTLVGHCYEKGSLSLPYLGFVEALRSYVINRDSQELKKELGTGAADVARIVSEIREKVKIKTKTAGDPEEERYRLLQGVTAFLTHAASVQPLLVVLEDLHDADKGTIDMLIHVSRNLGNSRLLIVGTYRDVEVDRNHPLSAALAELRRVSTYGRVLLRGLNTDEVSRMLQSITGQEVPWGLAEAVHRQTEGNPLFVQEVIRYLNEEGLINREGGHWQGKSGTQLAMSIPEGLRDVIGKRLSLLSKECNYLLSVASVIGREFAVETLRNVADMQEDEFVEALKEAVHLSILEERSQVGVIRYRFTHAFFRQTLYEEMIAPQRLKLHQQVARSLEKQYEKRLEEHAAELAEHYSQSTDPADLIKAVSYGEKAAQRAIDVYAYGEAARLLEQALKVQKVLDPADRGRYCDLLMGLCHVLSIGGEPRRALVKELTETFALAEELGDRARMSRASTMAILCLNAVGGTEKDAWGSPEAALWVERADRCAEPETLARAWADLGMAQVKCSVGINTGQNAPMAEGLVLLKQALELARRLGDPQTFWFMACLWLMYAQAPHYSRENWRLAEELEGESRLGVNAESAGVTLTIIAGSFLESGRRERAEKLFNEAEGLAQRSGQSVLKLVAMSIDAVRAYIDGHLEYAVEIGQKLLEGTLELVVATPLVRLGRADEAIGLVPAIPATLIKVIGRAFPGPDPEAIGILDSMIAARPEIVSGKDVTRAFLDIIFLEAAALVGHKRAAELLLRRFADCGLHTTGNFFTTCVDRHLGGAAALLGRYDEARQHYQEAIRVCTEMRFRPELALTQLQLAELLLEHYLDEKKEALEHLDFAIKEFREMKMQPSLERALRQKKILKA